MKLEGNHQIQKTTRRVEYPATLLNTMFGASSVPIVLDYLSMIPNNRDSSF